MLRDTSSDPDDPRFFGQEVGFDRDEAKGLDAAANFLPDCTERVSSGRA